ncbi:MAG: DUF4282 domain-containing protein [Methanoregula sp.]
MAKTCPSCGYHETDNQALYCNKCGYPFPQSPPRTPAVVTAPDSRPAPRTAKRPVHKKAGGGGFLSFGTLITENHLKLIYILGAAVIVLISLMGIAGMFSKPVAEGANMSVTNTTAIAENPAGSPLFWIGFLIVGSMLWRMFCELFVVLPRVHSGHGLEEEAEYSGETGEYGEEETAGAGWEGTGQMVECPKCHKIVPVEDLRECEHCGVQGCSNCIRLMGLLKKTMTCRECFEGE